jgi:hypothetical protein
MPLIAELQDFIGGRDVRDPGGDVLVKAAVPCFLSINFDIEQAAGETAPDLTVIRNQIAATVNARDFPGQLHSSIIADIVHNYLTKRQALGPIDLHGRIRQPDGSIVYVRDKTILEIARKAQHDDHRPHDGLPAEHQRHRHQRRHEGLQAVNIK